MPTSSVAWSTWDRKESCKESRPTQIRKLFRFEAAHVLPEHAGKCSRLHGHSYRFEVAIRGKVHTSGPARGMIRDFDEVERIVDEAVLDALDHRNLNDYIEYPTVENIVLWIWTHLEERLPGLDEVVLWETATSCALLRRSDFAG